MARADHQGPSYSSSLKSPFKKNHHDHSSCDVAFDYFPDKISVDHSLLFNVSYHGYWKRVTFNGEIYILVQKNCPIPQNETGTIIPIPLTRVGLGSSTYQAYLEILGERTSISALNGHFSASPCINSLIRSGNIEDSCVARPWNTCNGTCSAETEAYFGSSRDSCSESVPLIQVGQFRELRLISQLEWLEYFAVFFNKEIQVLTYLQDTESAISCLKSRIQQHVGLRRQQNLFPPRVLWATAPADSADPWIVGTCPNFFCEAIEAAGGTVLNANIPTNFGENYFGSRAVSTAELFAEFTDTDIILTGPLATSSFVPLTTAQCDKVFTNEDIVPKFLPARARKLIFDYGKTIDPQGGLDWFSSRFAEPDVLIEEIADIFYPELQLRGDLASVWWQNVYTQGSCRPPVLPSLDSLADACSNVSGVFEPKRNSKCQAPPADDEMDPNQPLLSVGAIVGISIGVALLVGAIVVTLVLSVRKIRSLEYQLLQERAPGDLVNGSPIESVAL